MPRGEKQLLCLSSELETRAFPRGARSLINEMSNTYANWSGELRAAYAGLLSLSRDSANKVGSRRALENKMLRREHCLLHLGVDSSWGDGGEGS